MRRLFQVLAIVLTGIGSPAFANEALLLFDGETGKKFAGCLNCHAIDDASVCNPVGDYGSVIGDKSIWNVVGDFGSVIETNSPWNPVGEGLRIVDANGRYYGRFTVSPIDQSHLQIVRQIVSAYKALGTTGEVRALLCRP